MNGLLVLAVVAGAAVAGSALQDAYSKPDFVVTVGDVLTEMEADELIRSSPPYHHYTDLDGSTHDLHTEFTYMRLYDEKYLCALPIPEEIANSAALEARSKNISTELDLVAARSRALDLIKPPADHDQCIYLSAGYWTFELCYEKSIRQFHAEPPGADFTHPKPQKGLHVYTLGHFKDTDDVDDDTAVKNNGEVNFLRQYVKDGEYCRPTGTKRSVNVEYLCREDAAEKDIILGVRELKTCHYQMVVGTSRLCTDVAFRPPKTEEPNPIVCRKVVEQMSIESSSHELDSQDYHASRLPHYDEPEMEMEIDLGVIDAEESGEEITEAENVEDIIARIHKVLEDEIAAAFAEKEEENAKRRGKKVEEVVVKTDDEEHEKVIDHEKEGNEKEHAQPVEHEDL